ncbi:MAG: hypothetical protein QW627_00295, partial [Thermoplasmata archaeon]
SILKFLDSFIKWMRVWNQLVNYRGLEECSKNTSSYYIKKRKNRLVHLTKDIFVNLISEFLI